MSLDRQPTQKDCDHGRDRGDEGDIHGALGHVCCSTEAHCAPPPLKFPEQTAMKTAAAASCGADEACGCHGGVPVFDGLDPRYKRVLWTVIAINGAMFFTEMAVGHLAGSQALKADALDFLADTVTYGLSLAVIGTTIRTRATAALFKGLSLSLMAVWVLGSTIYHTFILGLPSAELMGGIGVLALAANVSSVLLLRRYKDGDANVRSVWLCSRNDAIGNVVVMVAALGVWGTSTAWPDLAVAALMGGIFFTSSAQIMRQAWIEYIKGGVPVRGVVSNSASR
jgi:Co/Zn/Cd efflux system component